MLQRVTCAVVVFRRASMAPPTAMPSQPSSMVDLRDRQAAQPAIRLQGPAEEVDRLIAGEDPAEDAPQRHLIPEVQTLADQFHVFVADQIGPGLVRAGR